MCGIFGFVARDGASFSPTVMRRLLLDLFQRSEPRGQEASGLVVIAEGEANVFKRPLAPNAFMRLPEFRNFLDANLSRGYDDAQDGALARPMAAIGHCRLVTNGAEVVHDNNQPVVVDRIVGIHNGIVTNEASLVAKHGNMRRTMDVDSETLFRLMDGYMDEGDDMASAVRKTFAEVEGTASVAFFRNDLAAIALATNNGSLFIVHAEDLQTTFFASEGYILRAFVEQNAGLLGACGPVTPIAANSGRLVSFATATAVPFSFDGVEAAAMPSLPAPALIKDNIEKIPDITRCSKCILPATYPFIEFDEKGVCNYCRNHTAQVNEGRPALEAILDKHRSKDGSPDCLMAFSGGRDSSYGLHLLKTEYGMNPVAFSYDWGMVTGIARRNQARMCGKLGVEHILRAADIPAKRRYIRKNIHAWLKRPHLGMVPLFMAGDKEFFEIARQLRVETGIPLVVFCAGNDLERTDFKAGFAGTREGKHGNRLFALSLKNKAILAAFYASQYLMNPSYLNESFYDSLRSYVTTFIRRDNFLYLFHYLDWDEETINKTLIGQYGWETAEHSDNTWRIGDGYTAFINYIYSTIAGFTEYDTFRSQQIRYGLIDRDEAMRLVAIDSQPQLPTLREFAQQVGINLEEVLRKIDGIPKLY